MSDISAALRSARDMDEYLELRTSLQIIQDIKDELARGPERTLRDWFAGQALAGLATLSRTSTRESMPEDLSILAYGIADAMLAERSRPKSET